MNHKMTDQITLIIDGVEVTVPKGTLIVEAAKKIGREIAEKLKADGVDGVILTST